MVRLSLFVKVVGGLEVFVGRLLLVAASCAVPWAMDCRAAEAKLQYNRDVRPILAENCFACHGPDSAARKADLRLDRREAAVEMGAIVEGDAEGSELIRRIESVDPEELMPPPATKKVLTPEQRKILAQWIAQGAEYQAHWSLIAPQRPTPPAPKNPAWVRNPIDAFIAAKLDEAGLAPAAEADRRTLARRASLDLTGLPPAPELVAEFVADESSDAYEKYVDKLLASPRWGEHRGRYWLDVARYADTHGIHFDNFREMWSYRDWVIKAFNRNLPFDQFTIENLAGDLLPNNTLEDRTASGFNRCNITTNEGGAINEEYLVLYARDRTETTSRAWLGLTAGCAVCHDHKFDPITQKEFYALSAFFNNTTQGAMDGNIKDTPPVEIVPTPADRPRWEKIRSLVDDEKGKLDQRSNEARGDFDGWLAAAKPDAAESYIPTKGLQFYAPLSDAGDQLAYEVKGERRTAERRKSLEWGEGNLQAKAAYVTGGILEVADVGDFDSDQPFSYAAWVKLPPNDQSGAIISRLDTAVEHRGWDMWLEERRIGAHILHRWPDDGIKVVAEAKIPPNKWTHVAVVYDGSKEAAGVQVYYDGVHQQLGKRLDALKGSIRADAPLRIGERKLDSPVANVGIEEVRVYNRVLNQGEISTLASGVRLPAILAQEPAQRAKEQVDALYRWWLDAVDAEYRRLAAVYEPLLREKEEIRARGTVAYIMYERPETPEAFVLQRGEYDQRLDKVSPDTPQFLPPFPADLPRNRLGLAQWIVRPENPLTARVAVNRFWQEVFGAGLVRTAGDFGVSGELPSHPELLDWLAVDFRESKWDVKRLFRMIVTSAAYRQSAATTPEKLDRDGENRLLSRGPRFRMDAEMVRDLALETSGTLSAKIGGPSVKPYQPPGVWEAVAMIGSNTRDYVQDNGEALFRRSMYTLWKRSAPPASMDIFNAPSRESCVMCRERTNTPLQALVTLNDPQFVEAARHLAARTLAAEPHDAARRCDFMAERLLSRPLRDEERQVLLKSLARLSDRYAEHPEEAQELIEVGDSPNDSPAPPSELAAWTMAASELMNLDETVTK